MAENGLVIFSTQGVRASQLIVVKSDASVTSFVHQLTASCLSYKSTSSKTQKQVNKNVSRVDVYFEVDIKDISVDTLHFGS